MKHLRIIDRPTIVPATSCRAACRIYDRHFANKASAGGADLSCSGIVTRYAATASRSTVSLS
jgi:hypothetical protein